MVWLRFSGAGFGGWAFHPYMDAKEPDHINEIFS